MNTFDYSFANPLSAERLEQAFLALLQCEEERKRLGAGTCIQFSLEASEDILETCLDFYSEQGLTIEYLGCLPDGKRSMQMSAS